jgi:lipid II:glycine glycyltransferase (peptidoglycan interpeptide bridge formation enzyme)
MKYAKAHGKKYFDLYGIAPTDDPNHPWSGVTQFKSRFGGEVVHYNPTYDLPLKPLRYWLYQTLRSIRSRIR